MFSSNNKNILRARVVEVYCVCMEATIGTPSRPTVPQGYAHKAAATYQNPCTILFEAQTHVTRHDKPVFEMYDKKRQDTRHVIMCGPF